MTPRGGAGFAPSRNRTAPKPMLRTNRRPTSTAQNEPSMAKGRRGPTVPPSGGALVMAVRRRSATRVRSCVRKGIGACGRGAGMRGIYGSESCRTGYPSGRHRLGADTRMGRAAIGVCAGCAYFASCHAPGRHAGADPAEDGRDDRRRSGRHPRPDRRIGKQCPRRHGGRPASDPRNAPCRQPRG